MKDDESMCRHCGGKIILWPPPHWMHQSAPDRDLRTELWRYCRMTTAEPATQAADHPEGNRL